MEARRHSRRSSAASQLSAILRPFDFYEPLTLAALEQLRRSDIEQQTELPRWSPRPYSGKPKRLSVPSHTRTRSSWHAGVGKSQDGTQAGTAWTELTKTISTLPVHADESTISDGVDTEDSASLLQTPTHQSKRRSHRLSQRSLTYHSSARQALSDRHRSVSQGRRGQKRTSQQLSALPPMPNVTTAHGVIAAPPSVFEKVAPPIPPRAPSRVLPAAPRAVIPSGSPQAKDPDLVVWDGPDDPGNPMNWPRKKKWACTVMLGLVTFCVTFASSVFSAGTLPAAHHYGTSEEVMILGTALFVLGFSFGPIIWGPLSELYGRKLPLAFGFAVFTIFQIPVAVADNLATLFVCRFLAGFFGCAPLTIVGGALADFWNPIDRGVAVSVFSGATFLGPTSGPIVGGFLKENPDLGFRWNSWITLILSVILGSLWWIIYPESFGPVLLQHRAKKLRYTTRNWAMHAPADEIEVNIKAIMSKYLSKPFMMLSMEPILLLITVYISFVRLKDISPFSSETFADLCPSLWADLRHIISLLRDVPILLYWRTALASRTCWIAIHRCHGRRCHWRLHQSRLHEASLCEDHAANRPSATGREAVADGCWCGRFANRPFLERLDFVPFEDSHSADLVRYSCGCG